MNDSATDTLTLAADADLSLLADHSLPSAAYALSEGRPAPDADLMHLFRALQPGGTLTMQARLVPTKKHRSLYVRALESVMAGQMLHLHNEYQWARWASQAGFVVTTQDHITESVHLDALPLSALSLQRARILLAHCPSDLVEWVAPQSDRCGITGYTTHRLKLVCSRP